MNKAVRYFKLSHSEGDEIIVAESAREAINYFVNDHCDNEQIAVMCEFDGFKVTELKGDSIKKKHKIFNEETNKYEDISYEEIAKDNLYFPAVIVSPNC